MSKRMLIGSFALYVAAVLGTFAPLLVDAVQKIQVNTESVQTLSNKTFDSSNTFNGITFATPILTTPTMTTPTWSAGAFTLTPLTANSFLYVDGSKLLSSTAAPSNGQLLIGSTGTTPALATLTGTVNRITVTNGPGSITLSAPQDLAITSTPTFSGMTISGLTPSKIVTTNGSSVLAPLSSAIAVSDGGTGVSSTPSNGQLLIGNATGYTVGNLTNRGGIQIINTSGGIALGAIQRNYLSGFIMSTAGSSATMTIAAGQATDSTNAAVIGLGSSIAKTTSGWVVGSGNGCLDTGSIANSTWYHFYAIFRSDTLVVDVACTLSATTPALPASYTHFRWIGAGLTNGSAQWIQFAQNGDEVLWTAAVLDVNSTNPTASAVSSTLSVPTGIKVRAIVNQTLTTGAGGASACLLSALDQTDAAASTSALPLANIYAPVSGVMANRLEIRTNTSGQIRRRCSFSDANVIHRIATIGYIIDRRRES